MNNGPGRGRGKETNREKSIRDDEQPSTSYAQVVLNGRGRGRMSFPLSKQPGAIGSGSYTMKKPAPHFSKFINNKPNVPLLKNSAGVDLNKQPENTTSSSMVPQHSAASKLEQSVAPKPFGRPGKFDACLKRLYRGREERAALFASGRALSMYQNPSGTSADDMQRSVTLSQAMEDLLNDSSPIFNNPFPYISQAQLNAADMMPYPFYTAHAQHYQPPPAWTNMNNYPPCQSLTFSEPYSRMITTGNEVTGETVIALTNRKLITFIVAQMRDPNEADFRFRPFDFHKLQEASLPSGCVLSCFDLGAVVSVNLPPRKLMYAMAPRMDRMVYIYKYEGGDKIPTTVSLDSDPEVKCISTPYAVEKIAIGGEKFLACALANGTVGVWDIPSGRHWATFTLKGHVSHLSWHKSEPFKLMVVEVSGWVKFFNVFKKTCFMSFTCGKSPLYSADWCAANTLMAGVGTSEGFTVMNTSQMNSNMFRNFETPLENVSQMLFCPSNERLVVSLGREPGVIKLWKSNYVTPVWSHYDSKLEDVAWVHGRPFVIGLSYRTIMFFNAAVI